MQLKLWNTLGKRLTDVIPSADDGILRMYHCGPTVYDSPHIGNMRRFITADILTRTLRFFSYNVTSIMNITDVGHMLDEGHEAAGEDRMVVASRRDHHSPEEVAAIYTKEFFEALHLLRAQPADTYPKATDHIHSMIDLITLLLEKNAAYETSSGIYFDVHKFPTYGKLSGNTIETLEAGARVTVREEKRHPSDFALWVKADPLHIMQWDSPWGRGYPGWHIECSAMAASLLGNHIDIHTGGEDNIFPHHENEIAQSEAAHDEPFAQIWMHNAHLRVKGKKMSKSEGTFFTLNDLTKRGYDPLAFRFLVLQTHYRSPLNFSFKSLDAATEGLQSLNTFIARVQLCAESSSSAQQQTETFSSERKQFASAVANDLGLPEALSVVFGIVKQWNTQAEQGNIPPDTARELLQVYKEFDTVLAVMDMKEAGAVTIPPNIKDLLTKREQARKNEDFQLADKLRQDIEQQGYHVEDTAKGPRLLPF